VFSVETLLRPYRSVVLQIQLNLVSFPVDRGRGPGLISALLLVLRSCCYTRLTEVVNLLHFLDELSSTCYSGELPIVDRSRL
jgi:hypothetical protein